MAYFDEGQLLDKTVEITIATVSGSGEKASHIVNYPDTLAKFMQVVYDKLTEINNGIPD